MPDFRLGGVQLHQQVMARAPLASEVMAVTVLIYSKSPTLKQNADDPQPLCCCQIVSGGSAFF